MTSSRIIGIDPGSVVTGFGVIDVNGSKSTWVASGCIRLGNGEISVRLAKLFQELKFIAEKYQPQEAAIEKVFVAKNAASALKLGQARGAAICALAHYQNGDDPLPIDEYSPTEIKKSIAGGGRADKDQVRHMVRALLGINRDMSADESDALAVALCHAHCRGSQLGRLLAQAGAR